MGYRQKLAGARQSGAWTYSERVEALLASSIPNFVTQDAVLKATLLSQECSANGGFLVCLKFVRNLEKG